MNCDQSIEVMWCDLCWKCPLCCRVQLNSTAKVPWTGGGSQPMKCYVPLLIYRMDGSGRKSSLDKIYGTIENHLRCRVWPITLWHNLPWVPPAPPQTFFFLPPDVCHCLPCTRGKVVLSASEPLTQWINRFGPPHYFPPRTYMYVNILFSFGWRRR
jgi:hypothetical protein